MNARANGSQVKTSDSMSTADIAIAEYAKRFPPFGDLSSALKHELLYLRDFMEMADERATNHQKDGKLVALLDAAMPRITAAMNLADQLDGKIALLSGELEELEPS